MKQFFGIFLLAALFTACGAPPSTLANASDTSTASRPNPLAGADREVPLLANLPFDQNREGLEKAYFASGCFWCTEAIFERVRGVEVVMSGYTGGPEAFPTYQQVAGGQTGHAEAVVVYYDPEIVSYAQLVTFFFASHDPTQVDRQGPDVGPQYRSGIFYLDEAQRETAAEAKAQLDASGTYERPIATEITAAGPFYVAEPYHQDYYEQHPYNPYIIRVSRPKVEKFEREYAAFLKPEYR